MEMDMEGMEHPADESDAMTQSNSDSAPIRTFDSFAMVAAALAGAVIAGSTYCFKKNQRQLKQTVELLEKGNYQE